MCAALALKKRNIPFELFEAVPEIKAVGAGLGLGANAILSFEKLGIGREVRAAGQELGSLAVLDEKGKKISGGESRRIKDRFGLESFAIHRAALHEVLLEAVDKEHIHLGKRCIDFEEEGDTIALRFADGNSSSFSYALVCDGIHSPLRRKLLPGSLPRYAGYTCWRGVLEGTHVGTLRVSETWGRKGRFGMVPLADGQVYWFACINAKEGEEKYKTYGRDELAKHFEDFHAPVPGLIQATPANSIIHGDIYDLKPLSRFAFGRLLLMGDAAHATTPNMGQGACQAIEDAAFLDAMLEEGRSWEALFREFDKRRVPRTRRIVERSKMIGAMAQWENPIAIVLRNALMRSIPESFNEKQIEQVVRLDF